MESNKSSSGAMLGIVGLILLVLGLVIFIFFPALVWLLLPILLCAAIFVIMMPLAQLSQTNSWWQEKGLLNGGLLSIAFGLYGLINPPHLAYFTYSFFALGIIEILLWIFRRRKTSLYFITFLTNNPKNTNQKILKNIIWFAVIVVIFGVPSYFSYIKKSEPTAQQSEEPFTYAKNDQLFSVSKKEFNIADQFTATALKDQSQECGTNKTEQYFKDLLSKYTSSDKGIKYAFQYQGPTQDSGIWVVTVIPNKLGYANIDDFNKDFDICAAGADRYPSLVSDKYLLFVLGCSSGFDDGSDLPHGCDKVQEAVAPTIKLQSTLTQTPTPTPNPTANWKTYTSSQYGFEFQYPVSWKRVADANSSDGTTVTVIYPVSYPAQDFSARVAVYQTNLATTQKDNPLFQNKSFSTVTVNNISWVKTQMTGYTGILLDSFEYLTEKNGKTYDVGGSADLTNQILTAFKFTN